MKIVLIGGPNGAGKSTAAPRLLRGPLGVPRFVNADTIAQGLSAFEPEAAAITAGRIMLDRLRELASQGSDFAFEVTLASRGFASWIRKLKTRGYTFHLTYLYLPSPDMAVSRVADRVRLGGHNVPEVAIRRRYQRSLYNFFNLYMPLADTWWFYDNAGMLNPRLVACCFLNQDGKLTEEVRDHELWQRVKETYHAP